MVEPKLQNVVGKHAYALHLGLRIVFAVHRIDASRRAARNIHRGRPIRRARAWIQRVDLLHRPAAVVLVKVVIPSAAKIHPRNQQARLTVEIHCRSTIAHRETAETDAVAVSSQFRHGIIVAKNHITMRREDETPESKVVCTDLYLPVFQFDTKLGGVVKLHIFPFGQTHHGIGVGHDFINDDVVFRGFVNRKSL